MSLGLHFRVGSLLTAAFVALAAVLVIVLGLQVITAIRETASAGRLVTLAEADRTVFGSMQVLRVSRGDAQTALLNLDDPKAKLAEIRANGAAQFKAAVAVLPRIGGAGLDRLTTELQQRWVTANQRWDELEAYAAKPKAERDIKATDDWYKAMGSVIDSLNEASQGVAGEARVADPFIGELVGARQTAWAIRDPAGSECSAVRGFVAGGKKLAPAVRSAVDRYRGNGEAGWDSLKALMVRPGVPGSLRTALADADAEIHRGARRRLPEARRQRHGAGHADGMDGPLQRAVRTDPEDRLCRPRPDAATGGGAARLGPLHPGGLERDPAGGARRRRLRAAADPPARRPAGSQPQRRDRSPLAPRL
jgi:hypothetical protein